MTLSMANSYQYDTEGWGGSTNRDVGTGQSGLPSIKHSIGTVVGASYGFAATGEVIAGFCMRFTDAPGSDASFFQFKSGGSVACELRVDVDGGIVAWRITGTDTEIGRGIRAGLLRQDVETYVEVRGVASTGSGGELEVRLNGDPTPVLNLTGLNNGAATFDTIQVVHNPTRGDHYWSAPYLVIVDATAPNDFLGHIRYAALDANGNGASSEWVGSDSNSTDNYLLIDDGFTPDDDTTYVQGVLGDQDTYAFANMPTPPLSVIAVIPVIRAKKTDAGTRAVTAVIRRSSTDYDGDTEHFLGTSYGNFRTYYLEDPSTTAAWTEAGINALEAGLRVTS